MKTRKVKIDIDWVCHGDYEARKMELIESLRPIAMEEVNRAFLHCLDRLRDGGKETQSVTVSGTHEMGRDDETLFMFIGLLVNRDLPAGAVIFLAPTKKLIDMMGQSWMDVCEAKLKPLH